jgi:hypothetical protein
MFEIPKLSVFLLGMRGAGKTVFLASMYHHLLAYSDKRGYWLRCPDELASSELLDQFAAIVAPDGWPEGTQKKKDYVFECCYLPAKGTDPDSLCRITYVDYPGGWVLGQGTPGFSVQEKARSSDSILVLLDGKKIKDELEGRQTTDRSILQDVQALAPILMDCVRAKKPMHLLITKSDLLDPRVHTLRRIQDALFRVEPFVNVLRIQSQHAALHIAPVSSVGRDFAVFDEKTSQMRKFSGATVRPYNVDLSIALTMYDHLKAIADNLESSMASQIEKGKLTMQFLAALKKATDSVMKSDISVFLASDPTYGVALIQLLKTLNRFLGKKRDAINGEIKRMHESVSDQKSAFATVLSIQAMVVQRFEQQLPDCNLTKRLAAK